MREKEKVEMDGSINLLGLYQQQQEGYRSSSSSEDDRRPSSPWRDDFHSSVPCKECIQRRRLRSNQDLQKSRFREQLSTLETPPSPPTSTTIPSSISMERTPSGHSIISPSSITLSPLKDIHTLTDFSAAREMITHFRRRRRNLVEERILLSLIGSPGRLDNEALNSVLYATDKLFFHGRLAGRVRWEWSHPDSTRYSRELMGTTALRKAKDREGYETLIVLSRPMLWSGKYDQKLLLSTFLHEAVHCYLFIQCGFKAMKDGGHTEGFRTIARVIDRWAGGLLQLRNTKADLNSFEVPGRGSSASLGFLTSSDSESQSQSQSYSKTSSDTDISYERISSVLRQRLPRIDRARYRRAAEMSMVMAISLPKKVVMHVLDVNGNEGNFSKIAPRQGWSPFVAFAGRNAGS